MTHREALRSVRPSYWVVKDGRFNRALHNAKVVVEAKQWQGVKITEETVELADRVDNVPLAIRPVWMDTLYGRGHRPNKTLYADHGLKAWLLKRKDSGCLHQFGGRPHVCKKCGMSKKYARWVGEAK